MKKFFITSIVFFGFLLSPRAQDANELVGKVRNKLLKVNDYIAEGRMKTDVAFIKAPAGRVKLYFKQPNKFKLKRDGGISILPKGGVTLNMNTLVAGDDYVSVPVGEVRLFGRLLKIVKLLPNSENSDVILSTLYIDEGSFLIYKAATTTKENGTFEIEMSYGKYSEYGLPDKVIFSFNAKDYKIPKGVTLEFDDAEKKPNSLAGKKGRVELYYDKYTINSGFSNDIFK